MFWVSKARKTPIALFDFRFVIGVMKYFHSEKINQSRDGHFWNFPCKAKLFKEFWNITYESIRVVIRPLLDGFVDIVGERIVVVHESIQSVLCIIHVLLRIDQFPLNPQRSSPIHLQGNCRTLHTMWLIHYAFRRRNMFRWVELQNHKMVTKNSYFCVKCSTLCRN